MLRKGEFFREVAWEEALAKVAGELQAGGPDGVTILVSPDLTNESLFAARKFVRDGLGSATLDSTVRLELPGGPDLWTWLFSLPVSIKDILRADTILAVGLDSRFDFSVVGTKVRQAINAGARLVTIDPRDSNLARYTDDWLRPLPGREGSLLRALASAGKDGKTSLAAAAKDAHVDTSALERAAKIVASSERLAVIVGPQAFHYGTTEALIEGLRTLAERKNTNVIPLYFGANARGALELGLYQEKVPGGLDSLLAATRRPKVLYLVGDVPFPDRPDCDLLIVQDTYLPPFPVDVFLPAASFAEAGGTVVNLEGRVQEVVQIEDPPESPQNGFMRPDWRILSELANAMGCHLMNYKSPQDVFKDIRRAVPGFPAGINRRPRRLSAEVVAAGSRSEPATAGEGEFLLVTAPAGYSHRGVDLSSKVGGLKELALEEGLRMNPRDLEALGLREGDLAALSPAGGRPGGFGAVRADEECPPGVVYLARPVVWGGLEGRSGLRPLVRLKENPVRVRVSRHGA